MEESTRERPNANSSSSRAKRKTPACLQCRDRKVRCSGTCPCLNCSRRSETCVFEQDEKKVLVSERLLNDLKRKAGYQENDQNAHPEKRQGNSPFPTYLAPAESLTRAANSEAVTRSERAQSTEAVRNATLEPPREVEAGLGVDDDFTRRNPLVVSPSKFLTDSKGRRRFLGPSSTWGYSRHVIGLLKEHLQYHETPEARRNVDGVAFPLELPHVKLPQQCIDLGTLPPLDYAIYLTNTVKFHIGQSYHLMDESVFMANLFSLHNGGMQDMTSTTRLWLSQYFIVMALGKALLHRGFSKSCPFGKDYFLRGMEFLPDVSGLHDDPVLAMEVCCAIALYLQSVDHRNTAFVYLGIALRIALSQGMHHDMIDDPQNQAKNSRQKSAWWTLYILDRKFSYMMGAPSQISDNAITVSLPGSPYHPPQKIAAMDVHVKLSRLIGKVIDTVYAVDGKLPASFLGIMQSTLRELAQVAETLTTSLDLNFDGSGPINRTSGTLNLCYHQCIILATRPLLVCLLQEKLGRRASPEGSQRELSEPVKALLRTSCDSANKSLRTLKALQARDLLDVFLPFDLEYAFSAAFVLMLIGVLHPFPDAVDLDWMGTALGVIDGLIDSGHVSARFRHEDVERLNDMLKQVASPAPQHPVGAIEEGVAHQQVGDDIAAVEGLSATDILSVAELMGRYPVMEMDTELLEGDWLWEESFTNWQGMALPETASEPQ